MPGTQNDAFYDEDNVKAHNRHHENGKHAPLGYDEDEIGEHKKAYEKGGPLEVVEFEEPSIVVDEEPVKQSCGEVWDEYPKHVFFIFGNEFCERFSYYGMKAVLTLYLRNILMFDQKTSTSLYSAFSMLCYFSPILGSILADGYIGRFHTIMWVSLFYASGNVILAVAASIQSSNVHPWLDFIGLIIIGLGTGGIKPCVMPFGADQFRKGQERQLEQFFSIFYFAINAGSTISILVTPYFRVTPCLNQKTCYPLAFGVPAALMVVAVIFFAIGSFWYKKSPPKGNVFSKVAKTIGVAIKNKSTFEVKRDHWLDHYMDSHSCHYDDECREAGSCQKATFVEDVKAVLRVLVVYVPLPIFWALYEQQGSTWVIQATEMDSEIAPNVYFLPDQMGVLNAVMIMALIPIFSLGIYPLFNKIVKVTPLRKMSIGCFLAGLAYIVCMLIQINIKSTLPDLPSHGQTLLNVSNYVQSCDDLRFSIRGATTKFSANDTILKNETHLYTVDSPYLIFEVQEGSTPCHWLDQQGGKLKAQNVSVPLNTVGYAILSDNVTEIKFHSANTDKTHFAKSQSGEAVVTVNVNYYAENATGVVVAMCKGTKDPAGCVKGDDAKYAKFEIVDRSSKYKEIKIGWWGIFLIDNGTHVPTNLTFDRTRMGGIFTVTLLPDPVTGELISQVLQQAKDNTYSILWQVPQYVVISVGEILFSITANEFSYSQAPHSMKSVIFACYLLTDAVGNVIILIITLVADFGADLTWLFLIYACLMFVITGVFILIAIRYKPKTYVRDDDEKEK